jgi:hypothetical protein
MVHTNENLVKCNWHGDTKCVLTHKPLIIDPLHKLLTLHIFVIQNTNFRCNPLHHRGLKSKTKLFNRKSDD